MPDGERPRQRTNSDILSMYGGYRVYDARDLINPAERTLHSTARERFYVEPVSHDRAEPHGTGFQSLAEARQQADHLDRQDGERSATNAAQEVAR